MSNKNYESSNPFMKDSAFETPLDYYGAETMTISGAINKTMILFGILLLTSVAGYAFPNPYFMIGGAIVGLVLAIVAAFKPSRSTWIAPAYAAVEGLFVGSISAIYAAMYNGIIFQAVTLTLAVLFFMLMAYKYQWIVVNNKFRNVIMASTAAIATFYIISMIANFGFGYQMPMIHSNGWLGIGFSLFVVGLASMNLLLDFDNFDRGAQSGAPKYMEWYCGMSIMITIVWLYLEILRLLAKLSSRD